MDTLALRLTTTLIKQFEGCVLTPYADPITGEWTIGWGMRFLPDGSSVTRHTPEMTQAVADSMRDVHLASVADSVDQLLPTANAFQRGALYDFAWNAGDMALRESTLLRLFVAGHPIPASEEFGKWIMSNGQPLNVLRRRREAERVLFLTNPDQAANVLNALGK